MDERNSLNELVDLIRDRVKNGPPPRPTLAIVGPEPTPDPEPPPGLDFIARRMHERMIWQLIYAYPGCGFRDIYEHAVRGRGCLAKLSDFEVVDLHDKMDRARECLADGISLEDAGLL